MKSFFKKNKEIIMYLFFGVATTAVNWVIYTALLKLSVCGVTLANAIAWFGAVVFAFITNKLLVFESRDLAVKTVIKEGVSFFASRLVSGVFEIFLPSVLIFIGLDMAMFGIDGFLAKAIVSVLVIVTNYVLSKLIVFKKRL